jgi:hypothetical protein
MSASSNNCEPNLQPVMSLSKCNSKACRFRNTEWIEKRNVKVIFLTSLLQLSLCNKEAVILIMLYVNWWCSLNINHIL